MASPLTPALSAYWRGLTADRVLLLVGGALLADVGFALFRGVEGSIAVAVAGWLLAGVAWLGLSVRYRWPIAVGVLTVLIAGAYYPVTPADGMTPVLALLVVLYSVARSGQLAAALTLAAVVMLLLLYSEFVVFDDNRHIEPMSIVLLSGWLLSVIAFGHAMLVRHAYQRETEQRVLAAERERDVRARQSATEERLRIARELHDVLGHNISLINVQAAAAVHRSAKRPGETAELVRALESVRDGSREALRELRATLGVLRQVDEGAPTEPAPGLDRIGELAERAGAAGLVVAVETSGTPPVLPPQISLAAYRIVQESLTNVTRHAAAGRAVVRVDYAPGELRVRIEDDGRGVPEEDAAGPAGALGTGIGGMAERARALGGELTVGNIVAAEDERPAGGGPRAGGAGHNVTGFRVAARLPLPPAGDDGERPETATTAGTGTATGRGDDSA